MRIPGCGVVESGIYTMGKCDPIQYCVCVCVCEVRKGVR
jgi:hypothetical protein